MFFCDTFNVRGIFNVQEEEMNLQTQLALLLKDAVITYTKAKNTSDFVKKRLDINHVPSIHCLKEVKEKCLKKK